ncbi:hypothetical protein ALC56_09862 [Trachymyrmex septentrionalis]|uniref:Uncharacterized protein n=1 Tax=Trachymyrmex septentrionalis TaxID=34720 RepID=A0A151JUG7_9HYME|nr:hypothetical protein ALC56_09862 [Trachymyrmex septentrionalis]
MQGPANMVGQYASSDYYLFRSLQNNLDGQSDALTERIFLDTPPLSSDSSIDPIPISPRGIPFPTNSTDSVEFLKEIPPPPPRSYFRILESDTLESLIT